MDPRTQTDDGLDKEAGDLRNFESQYFEVLLNSTQENASPSEHASLDGPISLDWQMNSNMFDSGFAGEPDSLGFTHLNAVNTPNAGESDSLGFAYLNAGNTPSTGEPTPVDRPQETPMTATGTAEGDDFENIEEKTGLLSRGDHTDDSRPPAKRVRKARGKPAAAQAGNVEIKKMTEVKSRACDECRRRKTACYYLNSDTPKCFRCQMEDIECTFNSRTRASHGASGAVRGLPISTRNAPRQLPSGLIGPVEDYSQLPGRSLLKKTLSLQHPRSSFAVGQHGLWDQRVLESIHLDKSNQARVSSNMSLRQVGPDAWFMIRNEGGQADWVRDCDEIERLAYPYGRALVNCFFIHFQPEYPVLHEKIFVEKYMRTYRELMPALLGAVYLLGMRWWNHSHELSTVPKPEHIVPKLYDAVLTNFFKASGGSSLSLIQAGLLLLHCSFTDTRRLSICSVINAASLRLALNRNCMHWKLPRWEINLRIRLSWAVYSQSTWISLFESIPPLIHDSSWFLATLNADMFDTNTNEPVYNDALFIHLHKLSLVVHDMHNLLSQQLLLMYSNRASAEQAVANNANVNSVHVAASPLAPGLISPKVAKATAANSKMATSSAARAVAANAASEVFVSSDSATDMGPSAADVDPEVFTESLVELIKPLQMRLHEWYHALPPSLVNLDNEDSQGNFSLRVAYIAAEVTLHRFIIRVISSKATPQLVNSDTKKLLRASARERLDVAFDLLKRLRPQHLHQFWYFAAPQQLALIGLFAALMYTTSTTADDKEYFAALLRGYIERIQLFSDNEIMSATLRTMRSSIAGVPGLDF